MAVLGIAFKLAGGIQYRRLSNLIYLCMGWLGIFWIRPFIENAGWPGFFLVLSGGIAYTVGITFYAAKHRDLRAFRLASVRHSQALSAIPSPSGDMPFKVGP